MTSLPRWAGRTAALALSSAFFLHCGGGGSSGNGGEDVTGGQGGMGGDAATGGASTGGTNTGGTNTGGTNTGGTGPAAGGMGGFGGSDGTPSAPKELIVVAHGTSLSLLDIAGDELEVVSTASLPAAGLLAGHRIFNVIQQPKEQRLFVASSNDCSDEEDWCWGNGRIDLFSFTQTEIQYEGLAYEMNNAAFLADGLSCAEAAEEDTTYPGQEGWCQPHGLAFSADGKRLYVDEQWLTDIAIFSVDPATGELTFLAEGAGGASGQCLALHPNGTNVYIGTHVLDVSDDTVVHVENGSQGNACRVIAGEAHRLMTTIHTDAVGIYDLTDPEAPSEIARMDFGWAAARYVASTSDLSRLVVVGQNVVRLLSFDGDDFTELDERTTVAPDIRQNRSVALAGDSEEFAVVAYFRGGDGSPIESGGAVLYEIDPGSADGPLIEKDVLPLAGPSFATLRVIAEAE